MSHYFVVGVKWNVECGGETEKRQKTEKDAREIIQLPLLATKWRGKNNNRENKKTILFILYFRIVCGGEWNDESTCGMFCVALLIHPKTIYFPHSALAWLYAFTRKSVLTRLHVFLSIFIEEMKENEEENHRHRYMSSWWHTW